MSELGIATDLKAQQKSIGTSGGYFDLAPGVGFYGVMVDNADVHDVFGDGALTGTGVTTWTQSTTAASRPIKNGFYGRVPVPYGKVRWAFRTAAGTAAVAIWPDEPQRGMP